MKKDEETRNSCSPYDLAEMNAKRRQLFQEPVFSPDERPDPFSTSISIWSKSFCNCKDQETK